MKRLIRANTEYEPGGETFDGYMGAVGWKGKNLDYNLGIVEIAKIIKSQFKKKFPGYKISARTDKYSMGQSLYIKIAIPQSDLMPKDEFVKNCLYNPYQYFKGYRGVGIYDADGRWHNYEVDDITGMSEDERREIFSLYYDQTLQRYTNHEYDTINYGWEPIPLLNDAPLKYVHDLAESFNYDDSNSMVDYFDTNFYSHINYIYAG
jgi:hypothetical protein